MNKKAMKLNTRIGQQSNTAAHAESVKNLKCYSTVSISDNHKNSYSVRSEHSHNSI